jgi:hypothetical protein
MKSKLVLAGGLLAAPFLMLGCVDGDAPSKQVPAKRAEAEAKKAAVGKNVFLEIEGEKRRVLVQAQVCLRQGQLEQFLTRRRTKEHEAIVAADVDARDIHTALVLARAEPGHPVRFRPKYEAASGTTIKVSVEYKDKDKTVRLPARDWIRSAKTKKNLDADWVFAGSVLIPDPLDKTRKPFYAANDGDVICISNFDTALLDLPISSSRNNDDLVYEAHTERIPAVETPVVVILEPVLEKAKK